MAESLSKIRQRVGWGIARAENAVEEFAGPLPAIVPGPSALDHLYRVRDELTAWIDAGINNLDDATGGN